MKPFLMLAGGLCVLLGAGVSRADVWDEGGDADNTCSSTPDNDLLHGASQVHDLGALPGPAMDQISTRSPSSPSPRTRRWSTGSPAT